MTSIREAKKELKIIRSKILEMNPTQLVNFFKPFSSRKTDFNTKMFSEGPG